MKFSRIIFAFAAGLMAAASLFAQVNPGGAIQRDPALLYGKLSNGLTYYIMHNDTQKDRCEYYLMTNVGAIQESPAQDGLAHFLEHMALNGTKNFPGKGIINYMQSIGASFGGNINASTGVEQTMYMFNNLPTTREGMIDTALLAIHDYSAFVTNDPKEIDLERGVIIEEWRTRRNSQWRMREQMFEYLFKGSKYATCNIIGTKEGLETFPAEELQKFYKTWYRPDLQAVVVIGDIEPGKILEKIKTTFADIPKRENPEPKQVIRIPDNEEPIVGIITDPEAQITNIMLCYKCEPIPLQYRSLGAGFLMDLIQECINGMLEERLSDLANSSDAPFLGAGAGWQSLCSTLDAFTVNVVCADGQWEKAVSAAVQEIEKARRYGFTQAEYDRVKAAMIASAERATANAKDRKNSEIVGRISNDFFRGWPAMAPAYQERQLKGYLEVLPLEQINQIMAAQEFARNLVIIYTAPEREGLSHPTENQLVNCVNDAFAAEIERNAEEQTDTELLDPATLKGGKIAGTSKGPYGSKVFKLKNGLRVTVLPTDYKKDEVLVNLYIPGGASLIADEDMASLDETMVYFYNSLAGLGRFPQNQLQKMLSGKIANENISISDINCGIGASCSPRDLETLLQLIYLQITEPRFEESELTPAMARLQAIVPNLEKQPDYIFGRTYIETAYGNSLRHEQLSTSKLERISLASFADSYRKMFSNLNGADVVITGNVDLKEIKPLIERYFGSLPAAKEKAAYRDIHDDVVKGRIENVFTVEMSTPKTSCIYMITGTGKDNAENRALMDATADILDLIYTDTLREEEGGTYGAHSSGSITSLPRPEYKLIISFDTDPARAEAIRALAVKGLEELAANGPTEEQLMKVKGNMLKRIPERRINNAYWAGRIQTKYNTGLDLDKDAEKVIEKITAAKVKKFVADLLAQGNFITVVMNPAE